MHNEMYTTEYDVEKKFIDVIKMNWYKYNNLSSYEELLENFRSKLNLLNKDILNSKPLTDDEFKEIIIYLENKTIFEASQILRSPGKIDIIKRNGFPVYLKLVDLKDIEKNSFEVVHQIKTTGSYAGRFDVSLLINGLPFVQIELKKPGVEINQAFNQVLRYKKEGNYKGIFNFIQIFVISNEQDTKYFANNEQIFKSNCYVWSNKENEPINTLYDFEENFLFCPFLFRLVFNYMIDSARERKLYVMRPYQIYAFEALRERCLKQNANGYCFHSTGSGKTLTSFKFAHDMSKNSDIDKVFFLVDRKDLDDKTIDDFNSYMSTTTDEFVNVNKTDSLIKKIQSDQKLIISTINKMANALKGKNIDSLAKYKNAKMIFMFDECHRTQAGEMRKLIQNYFKNALYFGFTGTPIFTEEDEKTQNAKLTSIYFGKPVHTYTLKEAIGDHNVLPLCIDYVKTVKVKGESVFLDKTVQSVNYEEALNSPERCKKVAEDILEHFDQKTCGRRYNAILACSSIHLLNEYYNILVKNQLNIKIGAIYSYEANEDCKEGDVTSVAKDQLAKIIDEYNSRPENNSKFSLTTYAQYEQDVIKNFRNKQLDILLVVDKCLTGMDFKRCNTLYLDKSMQMHGLIQAISRTIRTYDEPKSCGNIVCYQTSRKTMDEALAHFNNDQDVYNDVTLAPLEKLVEDLNEAFNNCKAVRKLATSKSESEKITYIKVFRDLMRIYNKVNNYIGFDINKTNMDMKTYYELQGLYKDIYNEIKPNVIKESILNDIDFEISLLGRTKVNFDYLVELLLKYRQEHEDKGKRKVRTAISRLVLEINDKSKRELVERFVNSFMDDNIDGLYANADPVSAYEDFINTEKNKELLKLSEKYNVDMDKLKHIIEDYSFFQDDVELNKAVTGLLDENLDIDAKLGILENLPADIKGYFDKFDEITVY